MNWSSGMFLRLLAVLVLALSVSACEAIGTIFEARHLGRRGHSRRCSGNRRLHRSKASSASVKRVSRTDRKARVRIGRRAPRLALPRRTSPDDAREVPLSGDHSAEDLRQGSGRPGFTTKAAQPISRAPRTVRASRRIEPVSSTPGTLRRSPHRKAYSRDHDR